MTGMNRKLTDRAELQQLRQEAGVRDRQAAQLSLQYPSEGMHSCGEKRHLQESGVHLGDHCGRILAHSLQVGHAPSGRGLPGALTQDVLAHALHSGMDHHLVTDKHP